MFKEAKLKIERANHHIRDLNSRIIEFANTDNLLSIQEDPTGKKTLTFDSSGQYPEIWPLIIGDAIHNLRSALDVVVVYMTGDRNSSFPFQETSDNFENAIIKGSAKGLPETIKGILRNDIKPYKAGNYALWGMNKLSVLDKHFLVLPVVHVSKFDIRGKTRAQGDGETTTIDFHVQGVMGAPMMLNEAISRDFNIYDYTKPTIDVVFGPNDFFENKSVIETLNQFSHLVTGIILIFEKEFRVIG